MQQKLEKTIFEYAVVRFVPRVEREEFINVGVILYCAKQNFLLARYHIDEARIKCFSVKTADLLGLKQHLDALVKISIGARDAGPIAQLDMASRFRWLTATRSTIVQLSKVHPGYSFDAAETLDKLFNDLVLDEV